MKNEIFTGNRIFLEELTNIKMCMPDTIHWSNIKHIMHK